MLYHILLHFNLLEGAIKDSPHFALRLIGMLIGSSILGFLIGSMFALMAISILRSGNPEAEIPVKKALLGGGLSGAAIASIVILLLVFLF